MRTILIAAAAVVAVLAVSTDPGHAQNRRFCTQRPIGSWGFPNCAYDTFEQCRATASGTGAYCTSNPWYVEPEKPVRRPARRGRR
jgi:hypothetical protein